MRTMTERATRCFTCGQAVEDPPTIARLADGSACPTCVERLLESVPAALPAPREAVEEPEIASAELFEDRHLAETQFLRLEDFRAKAKNEAPERGPRRADDERA